MLACLRSSENQPPGCHVSSDDRSNDAETAKAELDSVASGYWIARALAAVIPAVMAHAGAFMSASVLSLSRRRLLILASSIG